MPLGQNLHKLSKEELRELRLIVCKIYFQNEGFTEQMIHEYVDERELDKLIDSLLPETVEECRKIGVASGFLNRKKFFLPTRIVAPTGEKLMLEDK